MASRFILLFYLVKYLSPAEVGIYGIIYATILIALIALGVDFYKHNSREILARNQQDWFMLIRDQFIFHGLVYFIVLPLLLLIFFFGFIEWQYVFWFYILLVLEHVLQELSRILVTIYRPLGSTWVYFFRTSVWVYPLIFCMYLLPETRSLQSLWMAWIVGDLIALVVGIAYLKHLEWRTSLKKPIDWQFVYQGMMVGGRYLGATLSLWGIMTIDRYFLKHYHGNQTVGLYTFYISIARSIWLFCDATISVFIKPKIIASYQLGNFQEYRRLFKNYTWGIIATVFLLSVPLAFGIYPIISLINKPFYVSDLPTYWLLLAAMSILILGLIPNFALYVRKMDNIIIYSTISGFAVALILDMMLVPRYGPWGAAVANFAAMSAMGLSQSIACLKLKTEPAAAGGRFCH